MKRNISRIGILTLILMIGITLYICIGINVMDKICWFGLSGGLNRVPESEGIYLPRDISIDMIKDLFGGVDVKYKEEYVKNNVGIRLYFPEDPNKVMVKGYVELSEKVMMNLDISYDYSEKLLVYEPVEIITEEVPGKIEFYYDEENVKKNLEENEMTGETIAEYQNYILYDVVIKTWVDANGGNYEWERMKLKKCSIDNTFLFEN